MQIVVTIALNDRIVERLDRLGNHKPLACLPKLKDLRETWV